MQQARRDAWENDVMQRHLPKEGAQSRLGKQAHAYDGDAAANGDSSIAGVFPHLQAGNRRVVPVPELCGQP